MYFFRSAMRVPWLGCVDMNSGVRRPPLTFSIRSQKRTDSRGS
jgi:hypothetical protein